MNEFWKKTMEYLLGVVLYHGQHPDEKTWFEQYEHEISNMINDIEQFHEDNRKVGLEISNEAMARFLVYTEAEHIGNTHIINKQPINEAELLKVAMKINDELN